MNRKLLVALIALAAASLACDRMLSIVVTSTATAAGESAIFLTATPPRQQFQTPYARALVSPIPPTLTLAPTTTTVPTETPTGTPTIQPTEEALFLQEKIENITYCSADGISLLGDIYFPKNVSGATPLLIYIHGGAWYTGSKVDGAVSLDLPALLDAGFTVASIDYRLAPEYKMPAMIEDVKCAVRSFRAHATKYNIDPDRIGVWGSSAGGHLASMLGVSDESAGFDVGEYLEYSSRVQAVVDMFGPANLNDVSMKRLLRDLDESVFDTTDLTDPIFAAVSPITYVSSDDPPFLILHGDEDKTVPLSQSQDLYATLITSGVDAHLVVVKGAGHGFGTPGEKPSRSEITRMIITFFIEKLKMR